MTFYNSEGVGHMPKNEIDESVIDFLADKLGGEVEIEEYDDDEVSVEQLMMHVISKENIEGVEYDKKEFQKGLKDISYVCGMITGLMNIGVCAVDALTYVINEHTFDNSIEVNKLLNELELNKTKVLMIEGEKRSV